MITAVVLGAPVAKAWRNRYLEELLAQPIQNVPPRDGLMLRLFFGRHLGPAACRSLVLGARAEAESRLTQYEAIYRDVMTEDENAGDRPYWLLTISAGKHSARAAVEWADEVLAVLDQLEQPEHKRAPEARGKQ